MMNPFSRKRILTTIVTAEKQYREEIEYIRNNNPRFINELFKDKDLARWAQYVGGIDLDKLDDLTWAKDYYSFFAEFLNALKQHPLQESEETSPLESARLRLMLILQSLVQSLRQWISFVEDSLREAA